MKRLYTLAKPFGRHPRRLALLLAAAMICISCGSDTTDLPAPDEGGGKFNLSRTTRPSS